MKVDRNARSEGSPLALRAGQSLASTCRVTVPLCSSAVLRLSARSSSSHFVSERGPGASMRNPSWLYWTAATIRREPPRWRKSLASLGRPGAIALLPGDFAGQALDVGADRGVLAEQLLDLSDRVEHR